MINLSLIITAAVLALLSDVSYGQDTIGNKNVSTTQTNKEENISCINNEAGQSIQVSIKCDKQSGEYNLIIANLAKSPYRGKDKKGLECESSTNRQPDSKLNELNYACELQDGVLVNTYIPLNLNFFEKLKREMFYCKEQLDNYSPLIVSFFIHNKKNGFIKSFKDIAPSEGLVEYKAKNSKDILTLCYLDSKNPNLRCNSQEFSESLVQPQNGTSGEKSFKSRWCSFVYNTLKE